MANRQSLWVVVIACSLLGMLFEVGVEGGFGSQDPQNAGRQHGPQHGSSPPIQSGKPTLGSQTPPPGYKTFPGIGTYKFHAYGATWEEAKKECEKEGAKMLVVNSLAESSVIKLLFLFKFSKGVESLLHVWVGVKEYGTNGKFFTNDGLPLERTGFNLWGLLPRQPNDPGDNDCVTFTVFGVLYDDPCHLKYAFVCEL